MPQRPREQQLTLLTGLEEEPGFNTLLIAFSHAEFSCDDLFAGYIRYCRPFLTRAVRHSKAQTQLSHRRLHHERKRRLFAILLLAHLHAGLQTDRAFKPKRQSHATTTPQNKRTLLLRVLLLLEVVQRIAPQHQPPLLPCLNRPSALDDPAWRGKEKKSAVSHALAAPFMAAMPYPPSQSTFATRGRKLGANG